jgi:hypothetical protein
LITRSGATPDRLVVGHGRRARSGAHHPRRLTALTAMSWSNASRPSHTGQLRAIASA